MPNQFQAEIPEIMIWYDSEKIEKIVDIMHNIARTWYHMYVILIVYFEKQKERNLFELELALSLSIPCFKSAPNTPTDSKVNTLLLLLLLLLLLGVCLAMM